MDPVPVRRLIADASTRPAEEQVYLWAERHRFLKRRWDAAAEDGTPFAFDLESRLRDGGVIFRAEHADYVIRQCPEPVYEIPLPDPEFAALAGWRVGNLHLPVEISGTVLRVPRDAAVQDLLDREGWPGVATDAVFRPLKVPPHPPFPPGPPRCP
jgi:urease accessory protein